MFLSCFPFIFFFLVLIFSFFFNFSPLTLASLPPPPPPSLLQSIIFPRSFFLSFLNVPQAITLSSSSSPSHTSHASLTLPSPLSTLHSSFSSSGLSSSSSFCSSFSSYCSSSSVYQGGSALTLIHLKIVLIHTDQHPNLQETGPLRLLSGSLNLRGQAPGCWPGPPFSLLLRAPRTPVPPPEYADGGTHR